MGFALAEEAARRGAGVTVIAANVQLPRMTGLSYLDVETAAELRAAAFERFADCDVLLMAAAIADYRPAEPAPGKIDKERHEALSLELVRTDDVLAELSGLRRPDQTLVGFAAEHGDRAIERARAKLERKGLDLIVFNDISRTDIGFDSPENEVTIVDRAHDLNVSRRSKRSVAEAVLDRVQELRGREASTRYSKEGL
jgi:phosphopantothenoylcysteine decarboxylase/phosphopantothenate--cysteine ligase